jgi:hypothetical protein
MPHKIISGRILQVPVARDSSIALLFVVKSGRNKEPGLDFATALLTGLNMFGGLIPGLIPALGVRQKKGGVQMVLQQQENSVASVVSHDMRACSRKFALMDGILGYKIKPTWTLQAGYRYLDVNYRSGGSIIDTATSGALLGVTIDLK